MPDFAGSFENHLVPQAGFYRRDTAEVARDLLGKHLVRSQSSGRPAALMITEVEVYDGFEDLASHARFGQTKRNAVMFGPPGHWYVYLCYGIHWLLNVVTREEGYPAAVLIRGAGDFAGPGRLTKALQIDGRRNGGAAYAGVDLWVEDRRVDLSAWRVVSGPRVGVSYAGSIWSAKPWRFRLVAKDAQP